MKKNLFYIIFLILALSSVQAETPKFSDYTISEIYQGKNNITQKGDEYNFNELKNALKNNKVNYAGHYIIYVYSCGNSCVTASIADATTGKDITSLPRVYYVEGNNDGYDISINNVVNSNLLEVSGVDAQTPNKYRTDYYLLENNKLKEIKSIVENIDEKRSKTDDQILDKELITHSDGNDQQVFLGKLSSYCKPMTSVDDQYERKANCFFKNEKIEAIYLKVKPEVDGGEYLQHNITTKKDLKYHIDERGLTITYKWLSKDKLKLILMFDGGVTTLYFEEIPTGVNLMYSEEFSG